MPREEGDASGESGEPGSLKRLRCETLDVLDSAPFFQALRTLAFVLAVEVIQG